MKNSIISAREHVQFYAYPCKKQLNISFEIRYILIFHVLFSVKGLNTVAYVRLLKHLLWHTNIFKNLIFKKKKIILHLYRVSQFAGLKTALIEGDDFASGTSSRSTKLIHGGVRYLQKAIMQLDIEQYKMVKEALHERASMIHNAPHLAHPLPIMLPVYTYASHLL